jgi:large subunit ribosomal protein L25
MVDVTKLEMNESIRIREINAGEGIEVLNSPGVPVATVEIPRALRSAASAAEKAEGEEGEEGAEGAEGAETAEGGDKPAED